MKKALYLVFLLIFCCSCEYDKIEELTQTADRSVIMFFPWSTNLKSYFDGNIRDFASAIANTGLDHERVFVCIETRPDTASILELKYKDNDCYADTLIKFQNTQFTTAAGIARMLNTIQSISRADKYSLIIGCHGMGWIPASALDTQSRSAEPLHYEVPGAPLTRFFGGLSAEYRIEISTLADGISSANMHMEYILFDDCYMSSVEVAYTLRNVTDYLIACPTEVMAYGFPYQSCGKYLLGTPDYYNVAKSFYNFYSYYEQPYGTIAVTDCSQLDDLAAVVREINLYGSNSYIDLSTVQKMDGYTPTIFYDLGDMMRKKCNNTYLYNKFVDQLDRTVPHRQHTRLYYTAAQGPLSISTFSGITTSDQSTNSRADSYSQTEWYKATH
jgi:hypothetical protein